MKSKLDSYKGRLTPSQISEGMNAACNNAHRLVSDAFALLCTGGFPSALALAILAVEEAGKVSILRRLALAVSDAEYADVWREYRTHTSKNAAWIFPSLVRAGAKTIDDFRPLFAPNAQHPYVIDQLKQIAIYTDCLGRAHWSIPAEVIDEPLARSVAETAKVLAGSPTHTEKEIALWIEHMGPAFASQNLASMKNALVSWHDAMKANGLQPDSANGFDCFVRGSGSE